MIEPKRHNQRTSSTTIFLPLKVNEYRSAPYRTGWSSCHGSSTIFVSYLVSSSWENNSHSCWMLLRFYWHCCFLHTRLVLLSLLIVSQKCHWNGNAFLFSRNMIWVVKDDENAKRGNFTWYSPCRNKNYRKVILFCDFGTYLERQYLICVKSHSSLVEKIRHESITESHLCLIMVLCIIVFPRQGPELIPDVPFNATNSSINQFR